MLKIAPHIVLFIIIPVISFVSTDAFSESISRNDTASSLENLNDVTIPIINGTSDESKMLLINPFAAGCNLSSPTDNDIYHGAFNKTNITDVATSEFRNKGNFEGLVAVIATNWLDSLGNSIMPANTTSFTITDSKTGQNLLNSTLLSTEKMNIVNVTKGNPILFHQIVTVTPFENATNFGGNVTQNITFSTICWLS